MFAVCLLCGFEIKNSRCQSGQLIFVWVGGWRGPVEPLFWATLPHVLVSYILLSNSQPDATLLRLYSGGTGDSLGMAIEQEDCLLKFDKRLETSQSVG